MPSWAWTWNNTIKSHVMAKSILFMGCFFGRQIYPGTETIEKEFSEQVALDDKHPEREAVVDFR
jgi:hypothetical protein